MTCGQNPTDIFWFLITDSCASLYNSHFYSLNFDFSSYVALFFSTVLLEMPAYFVFWQQSSLRQCFIRSLAVNLSTHPLVCILFPWVAAYWQVRYWQYVLFSEGFAVIVEALVFVKIFKIRPQRAIVFSLFANLFSWLVGGWLLGLLR